MILPKASIPSQEERASRPKNQSAGPVVCVKLCMNTPCRPRKIHLASFGIVAYTILFSNYTNYIFTARNCNYPNITTDISFLEFGEFLEILFKTHIDYIWPKVAKIMINPEFELNTAGPRNSQDPPPLHLQVATVCFRNMFAIWIRCLELTPKNTLFSAHMRHNILYTQRFNRGLGGCPDTFTLAQYSFLSHFLSNYFSINKGIDILIIHF